ncbi:MAG TPA: MFS transporter [Ramlibacter sp.]|nr:MFS transporter [Ramlibacter sp.]
MPAAPAASLWSAFLPLLPLMAVVFGGFFASGMALPVVPRHAHETLGQGTLVIGIVMGAQYVAAILLGRVWSGVVTDTRGPLRAMRGGLLALAAVGLAYAASFAVLPDTGTSLGLLMAGRLLVGLGEAFVVTATLSWGITRLGPEHAGKVIGWVGVALFIAYGLGAPVGSWIHGRFGFGGLAVVTAVVPLLTLCFVSVLPGVVTHAVQRPPFYRVLGLVRLPGIALTLSSFGYAALTAFAALLWLQRGWGGGAPAFTSMGLGFILARLVLGHLPDQLGGARVAAWTMAGAAVGQALMAYTSSELLACLGAALTGAGYGLAFQAFGVEAVRRAPPESRGVAMGGYVVFQDLSMAVVAPLGGWLATLAGLGSVYVAGAVAAVAAVALAVWMQKR